MISLQHAPFSSVLACAAATALPPSPAESTSRCESPTLSLHQNADADPQEQPVIPAGSAQSGTVEERHPGSYKTEPPSDPPTVVENVSSPVANQEPAIKPEIELDQPQEKVSEDRPDVFEAPGISSQDEVSEERQSSLPIISPQDELDEKKPDVLETPRMSLQDQATEKPPGVTETPSRSPQVEVDKKQPDVPEAPRISFAQFARQLQLENHQRARKSSLLHRLRELRVCHGMSMRLLRIGSTVQKGLSESFKQGDKSGFVCTYNAICDMHDFCDTAFRRSIYGHDPLVGNPPEPDQDRYPNFIQRLTHRSREDLLEILTLARTDSQFLFRCIAPLIPSHLSSLISPVHDLDVNDIPPRGRTQPLFSKRATTHSSTLKDHVFAFERTDPLSALVFNAFAHPLDFDTPEARLRLDVWSSTCAKLISYGGSGHYSFVGHLLSCWADAREWKAKPKFETYLMNVLQEGAFLLEHHDLRHLGIEGQFFDPLQTDVAENFFQSAVSKLFEVLDDSDGGLPAGALEFGTSILRNLNVSESRKRFSDYLFFQWFFCKFLFNALSYPESLGLLLDFHVSKGARERLLGQIALRAQTQVSHVLQSQSLPRYSIAPPDTKAHIENMLSHLDTVPARREASDDVPTYRKERTSLEKFASEKPLLLSAPDIIAILDVLFPKTASALSSAQSYQNPLNLSPTPSYSQQFESPSRGFQPSFFQGKIDTLSSGSVNSKTVFTTEMSFQDATGSYTSSPSQSMSPVSPDNTLTRNAERIRFEIAEISKSDGRPTLDHPANENWATIYVSADGNALSFGSSENGGPAKMRERFYEGFDSGRSNDDESDSLREAVLKLVEESRVASETVSVSASVDDCYSLPERFANAMEDCQRQYDFLEARYWWNASRLLSNRHPNKSAVEAESETLSPMMLSAKVSTEKYTSIIRNCENQFVDLKRSAEHFQQTISKTMTTLQKLRNKMWYMTDVKNSLRYEDAKNVAFALKKMVPQATLTDPEPKQKHSQRNLGGSFFQRPEIQVLNVMRAPENQGGPSKLSDEQVEITRKWIERFGIDNFCKGEERIHRFCYEVKTSVNKLVGETMYETPVLWSSELFQKERSMYESSGMRPGTGMSLGNNVRPTSIASEESLYHSSQPPFAQRAGVESLFRPMNDMHSLGRKSSYQSLGSDRWKPGRDIGGADTSSVGDSPGRTISTSTGGDLNQSFWSPSHTQAQSMTSASSLHSRPPSMLGEVLAPKRSDRKAHRKTAFLDDLKRTMTSLLLSDLGSPVWSCGSETDAWFLAYLNRDCIKEQTRKRARMQKILADLDTRARESHTTPKTGVHTLRRSRSVDLGVVGTGGPAVTQATASDSEPEGFFSQQEKREQTGFAYCNAFRELMDKFSRPANPFVKLKALQDMRSLVVASLSEYNTKQHEISVEEPGRHQRNSVSGPSKQPKASDPSTPTPHSPISDSLSMNTESLPNSTPSEDQIIHALRDLIQTLQPKTLFRDLQFIAAFVPSETLNRTDSGAAFLHFGLAAFSLKDEICNSIVEIADSIVSRELNKRGRRPTAPNLTSLVGQGGIKDAAQMWVIPAREGNPVAQRELAILYLTHPDLVRCVTLPLTMPRDTFKTEMMYRRDEDSKSDPQSMCLALHWMKLAAAGGDKLAQNRLREREEFESIA